MLVRLKPVYMNLSHTDPILESCLGVEEAMGKYSDSDDDVSRRAKKKKKKKSRSRSVSSGESRYSHTKHKKSKRKHRQRSKSRSPDRRSKRDRSPPRKRRSRSSDRSRSRRSRSFDRRSSRSPDRRRSRSYERSRRSRSYSRGRRSRSGSRGRMYRDRDRRSRSDSGSRSHSRRSSPNRRAGGYSESPPHLLAMSESNTMDSIPGFSDMTPAEQAQARLKMALRAAAMADEKLKENAPSPSQGPSSPLSRQDFANAVASIESDAFSPAAFKSSRSSKSLKDSHDAGDLSSSHTMAMFGAVGSSVVFTKSEPVDKNQTPLEDNPETLFHTSLQVDPQEKMNRWIQKLSAMRKKKLEGEVISY